MITAPIKGDITFEGAEGFEDLPAFPENVHYPAIAWTFTGTNPDLLVTLTIGDGVGRYRFCGKDSEGILPNERFGIDADTAHAINAWAKAVQARLRFATNRLLGNASPEASEAYEAILAFATEDDVNPGHAKTAKERALERANDALKPYVTFADDELERPGRFRDLLTDLMHAANEQGVDFDEVLNRAYRYYQEDLASPGFDTDAL